VYPVAVVGGPCNDPTQPCYTVHVQNGRYTMPSTIINEINKLKPGMWYIFQVPPTMEPAGNEVGTSKEA
jgi:hypothetical protein